LKGRPTNTTPNTPLPLEFQDSSRGLQRGEIQG